MAEQSIGVSYPSPGSFCLASPPVLDPDLIDSSCRCAASTGQRAGSFADSERRLDGRVMTYFMGDESAQFAKLRPRLSPLCLERPLDLRQPELRRIASTSAAALTAYRPRGPRDATCKSTAGDLFPRKATKIDRKRRVCTVWTTSPASSRPTANISEDITNMNELKHSQRSARSVEIDDPSGKGALYKHFFDRLVDELRDKHKFTNAKAGAPKNWHTFGAGTSGFTYAAVFASGGRIRVEVYIDLGKRASNVAALEVLQAQESALSKAFAEPLQWELLEGKQACRIAVYRSRGDRRHGRIPGAVPSLDGPTTTTVQGGIRSAISRGRPGSGKESNLNAIIATPNELRFRCHTD